MNTSLYEKTVHMSGTNNADCKPTKTAQHQQANIFQFVNIIIVKSRK